MSFDVGFEHTEVSKVLPSRASTLSSASSSTSSRSDEGSAKEGDHNARRFIKIMTEKANLTRVQSESLLESLHLLRKTMIELSTDSDSFEKLVSFYSSTTEGLMAFKKQVEKERALDGMDWTRENEDETYDALDPAQNRENSIYAQVRHNFRLLLGSALNACNQNLQDYAKPMECLAGTPFIPHDPFKPPSRKAAMFLHMQLHGNLESLSNNDYGAAEGKFKDEVQQRTYARDLIIVKRAIFRRLLFNRLISSQRVQKAKALHSLPVHSDWECTGTWVAIKADAEHMTKEFAKIVGAIGRESMCETIASFLATMLARLELHITNNNIIITGNKVLLGSPQLVVPFAGPPEIFRPATPIPFGPMLFEHKVTGWLSQEPDGKKSLTWVILGGMPQFGRLASKGFDALSAFTSSAKATFNAFFGRGQKTDDSHEGDLSVHKRARDFVSEVQGNGGTTKVFQIKKMMIDRVKDQVHMVHHFFITSHKDSVDNIINDRVQLASLCEEMLTHQDSPGRYIKLGAGFTRYMRDYMETRNDDALWDLLIDEPTA